MAPLRTALPLLAVIVIAWLMRSIIGPFAGDYPTRIFLDGGIAIIMAVSLNIVNGFTGQFSIGHAAFMAIGGYASGFVTYYASLGLWQTAAPRPGIFGMHEWLFAAACVVGGL